jgi:hypothetical protein
VPIERMLRAEQATLNPYDRWQQLLVVAVGTTLACEVSEDLGLSQVRTSLMRGFVGTLTRPLLRETQVTGSIHLCLTVEQRAVAPGPDRAFQWRLGCRLEGGKRANWKKMSRRSERLVAG